MVAHQMIQAIRVRLGSCRLEAPEVGAAEDQTMSRMPQVLVALVVRLVVAVGVVAIVASLRQSLARVGLVALVGMVA